MAAMSVECGDFLQFQDTLRKMRQVDDNIIHMLNTTIPTESFKAEIDSTAKCKDLFEQIETNHNKREQAITKCLSSSREKVIQLKKERDNNNDNIQLLKTLKKEQNTMRLLQSELNIEEIVRKRTLQIFYERCRNFYKPSSLKL
ncbi:coiled-coil domain-containing 58 [Nomia melanderi]|uniref:coiled-coil domain-containing 58 n=1 Tax=Nomia melanderi TaxID=2448451 RepID=UPI0013042A3F|nr:coiled-coil domain-containing protein 58 [Nomia melanderi]